MLTATPPQTDSTALPAPDTFRARLMSLQILTGELAKAASFDALCQHAVRFGVKNLHFDRLGLWWQDGDHPTELRGSFGVDENGEVRDERHRRVSVAVWSEPRMRLVGVGVYASVQDDDPLYNDQFQRIGNGCRAAAQVRSGDDVTGWLFADNLFGGQPFTADDLQLLGLYANTIGQFGALHLAQERLAAERNMLRTIIDAVPDQLYVRDTAGRYTLINRAAWECFPQLGGETDIVGQPLRELNVLTPDLIDVYLDQDRQVIQTGAPLLNLEDQGMTPEGSPGVFLTSKSPLRDSDGNVIGIIGISRDITDFKAIEGRARQFEIEQERVRLLHRLISNLSHDLRTPLAIINTTLHILGRVADPEQRRERYEVIRRQTGLLEQFMENVLTLFRLENSPPLARRPVNLNDLANIAVTRFQQAADAKSIRLSAALDAHPPLIVGDAVELARAVNHVVQNAIAYTPAGGAVTLVTDTADGEARLHIHDTGVGITPDEIAAVFEPFYRAEKARPMDKGGMGLGLAIAQRIVQLHGGSLGVESERGVGSRFTLALHAAPPA